MDNAFVHNPFDVLAGLGSTEESGLSEQQVLDARQKYGPNGTVGPFASPGTVTDTLRSALAEDPPTPLWELVLEQFKDQLVIILLGSAAVSFVLALFEEDGDWTAFVDPMVVRTECDRLTCSPAVTQWPSRF